tara:strand:+ start:132 stop:521 length:390 start_codon:yes stop_codon:yes gene_type:complete
MEDDFDQFIESYLNERQRYADYRDIANFDLTIAGGAKRTGHIGFPIGGDTTVIDIKFQISDDDDWICGEMQLINEKHPSRIFTYNSSLRPNLPVDVNKFFRYYNQCVQILREKQDRTPEQTWFLDYISS